MENVLDRFDAREELLQGDPIFKAGEVVSGVAGQGRGGGGHAHT